MMESPDQPDWPDSPDWPLLSSLFSRDDKHRHRMGLRRADPLEFYAATADGPAIRREKQVILDRDQARRMVVTPEGHCAAIELARHLRTPVGEDVPDDETGWRAYNRSLGLALEPDILLVQPPDWSLTWANVCFPSRWSLDGKARRPLAWIHDVVPDLNAELGSKIAAFLSRLNPGEGWQRANWGLSASCRHDQHPDAFVPASGAMSARDEIYIRVEDQHLLKLPETGTVAFGIRIYSFAWSDVRQDRAIAASLLVQLRSMSPEVAHYKGIIEIIPSMMENL